MPSTSMPSAMNRSQRCDPKNPAAPVMSTLGIAYAFSAMFSPIPIP